MVSTMTMTQTISPRQHKLRTYVVLTSKSSRNRLPSFSDLLEEASSPPSTSAMKTKTTTMPDDCIAYESYAAVASRFQAMTVTPSSSSSSMASVSSASSPTRDLRWSDISRPRLHIASFLANGHGKQRSQKARKRQLRRAQSSSSSTPNDHLEVHALELCFEFLDLSGLQTATHVCTEFRDLVHHAPRLLVGLYARKWLPAPAMMARAYYALEFKPLLAMYQQRRGDVEYAVATRSQVTKRADTTLEIVNNSLLRILTRSTVDSVRGTAPLPVLSCAQALGKQVSYFEVAMKGCGSVGVVSVSDTPTRNAYGYGSDEHVGWKGVSFGYHGNDGDFVYNDGTAPYGGEWKPYGPSWGHGKGKDAQQGGADAMTFIVGCGLDLATRRVFFTLNGTFLGFAPVSVPQGEYAAAVALHEFDDRAIMNGGSAPFKYDIEGFCASL